MPETIDPKPAGGVTLTNEDLSELLGLIAAERARTAALTDELLEVRAQLATTEAKIARVESVRRYKVDGETWVCDAADVDRALRSSAPRQIRADGGPSPLSGSGSGPMEQTSECRHTQHAWRGSQYIGWFRPDPFLGGEGEWEGCQPPAYSDRRSSS